MRFEQRVTVALGDVSGDAVQQRDLRVIAGLELAEILAPDTSGAIVVTHSSDV